jgi:NAD(P)-dependent dehydrogenase (short-subunit alcohol dehydrogenase family)
MKLKGKKALITGGSKGIGKGIAEAYLKEGAEVIICGRDEESLKATHEELSALGNVSFITADISDKDDAKRLALEVEVKWGELDILVNNASILGTKSRIVDYPEDVWEEVIHINLNAQFFITKALLRLLIKTENSSIINVSSTVGRIGKKGWGAYSASKFGVEALTQILADEMESTTVRANSVNPGGTRTDMRADAYPDEDPMTLPSPMDISPVFVYLASDESIGVSGEEFNAREWIGKE